MCDCVCCMVMSLFSVQRPNVGEYHIHKLRHKPLKAGSAGGVGVAGVGGASSLEDIPAAYSHPTHSLPPAMDSDNDSPHKRTHQRGAEPVGGKQLTDSDPLSDDSVGGAPPSSLGKKCVAINTEQVEHFTHRLLPVQSPEFDNVMDQVCARVPAENFFPYGPKCMYSTEP